MHHTSIYNRAISVAVLGCTVCIASCGGPSSKRAESTQQNAPSRDKEPAANTPVHRGEHSAISAPEPSLALLCTGAPTFQVKWSPHDARLSAIHNSEGATHHFSEIPCERNAQAKSIHCQGELVSSAPDVDYKIVLDAVIAPKADGGYEATGTMDDETFVRRCQ